MAIIHFSFKIHLSIIIVYTLINKMFSKLYNETVTKNSRSQYDIPGAARNQ